MYRHGWERQRTLDLFAVLDRMTRQPDALQQSLWKDIETIEGGMRRPYVTRVVALDRRAEKILGAATLAEVFSEN